MIKDFIFDGKSAKDDFGLYIVDINNSSDTTSDVSIRNISSFQPANNDRVVWTSTENGEALNKKIELNIKNKLMAENCELQKQLAEKEKEIEKLNACVDFYKSYSVSFQEKIIDELERVKEFCNNPKNRVEYEYCPNAWTYAVDKDKLMLEIDNQIKQLKEIK